MENEEATRVIAEIIDKKINAKMIPIGNMIIGLELAIIHIFNSLHHRGLMTRDDLMKTLDQTILNAQEQSAPPEASMVLRHIQKGLEEKKGMSPEQLRGELQLILGGLSDEQPSDTDPRE